MLSRVYFTFSLLAAAGAVLLAAAGALGAVGVALTLTATPALIVVSVVAFELAAMAKEHAKPWRVRMRRENARRRANRSPL